MLPPNRLPAGTLAYPEEAGVGAATLCSGTEFPHCHPPLSPEGRHRCGGRGYNYVL